MPTLASQTSHRSELFTIARMVLLSTVLFLGVMGFTMLLSSSALHDLSKNTYLSAYQGLGEQLQNSFSRGLRYGRPLSGYAGITKQMENALGLADGLEAMAVVDVDGRILYSARKSKCFNVLESLANRTNMSQSEQWIDSHPWHISSLPLKGRGGQTEGLLVLIADNEMISILYRDFINRSLVLLLVVAVVLVLVLSGWLGFIIRGPRNNKERKLHLTVLFIVGLGQIVFGILSVFFFTRGIDEAVLVKINIIGKTIARDLDRLYYKNVDFQRLSGLTGHFESLIDSNPEIGGMEFAFNGHKYTGGGSHNSSGGMTEIAIHSYWPDNHTPISPVAYLRIYSDPDFNNSGLRRMYLNLFSSMVISLLLLMELSRILATFGLKYMREDEIGDLSFSYKTDESVIFLVRTLAFIFFMGYDMVLSIVPITAASLPGKLWPVPESLVTALPITTEAIMGGVGILLAGKVFKRMGLRGVLYVGIVCSIAGAASAFVAPTVFGFIAARAVSGFGFGLVLMACQLGLLAIRTGAWGLAQMYSGVFIGNLCGVAGGAMAADLCGFQNVFGLAVIILIISLLIVRHIPFQRGDGECGVTSQSIAGPWHLLVSPRFLAPVLLVTIPIGMTLAGFLYFNLPVQLHHLGIPQSDIGRIFMIYSLSFIVIGPWSAKRADKSERYGWWVALAGLLNGLALFCAWGYPGYLGYAVSAGLSGFANSILTSNCLLFIIKGIKANNPDKETVSSVYRMVERLGHIAGPLVFGLALSEYDRSSGLVIFTVIFSAAAIFFLLGSIKYGKQREV